MSEHERHAIQNSMTAIEQLLAAIAHMEAQRAILGDAVVEIALASLQEKLTALERQAPAPPLTSERKLVTVMFADISGFTDMVERMDPEAVRDMINACFERLVPIIEKYEGTVDRFIGDAIMALFGAPLSHENDPERALRAALEIMVALDTFNAERGTDLGLHFGISTGMVIAGGIGTHGRQEYSVVGGAVPLASRLEDVSERGEILVGPETYRLTAPLFKFEPLEPIRTEGKSEPVPIYRLLAAQTLPSRARGIASLAAPLVGRQDELNQLLSLVQPIFEGSFAGLVYLYGEAGIGKSRLAHELRQYLTTRGPGRGVSWFLCPANEILRQSLNPIKHFLRHYFDQSPDRSGQNNRDRFTQVLDQLIADLEALGSWDLAPELDRTRPFLGALVDLHWENSFYEQLEPKLRFENTLMAFTTLMKAESRRRPVILQMEDIHWLETDSQELVKVLTRNMESCPLAVLCTSRYRDDGSRVTLDVDPSVPQQVVELGTLALDNIRLFAEQTLAGRGGLTGRPSDELVRFLEEKTGGNPFFIEQLLLDLGERAVLEQAQEGTWTLKASEMAEIPTKIGAVLIARLDRLASGVKEAVQTAAVLGREFELQVLSRMLQVKSSPIGEEQLLAIVKQGEVEWIWSVLREMRYIFRHALMRDAAYEMQLRARLRELHRLAAEAIEQVYAADPAPHYADLAYHYGHAEKVAHERHYARLAGEQAAAQFANTEAVRYFSRALDLTPVDDLEARYVLRLDREKVYDLQGARPAQEQDLIALAELAEGLNSPYKQAKVALRQANYAQVTGDYSVAIAAAQRAIDLAQKLESEDLVVQGHLSWGTTLMWQGNHAESQVHLEQAFPLIHQLGTETQVAQMLRALGNVAWRQGEYAMAQGYYQRALPLYQKVGDRQGEGATLNNLGSTFWAINEWGQALDYYQQALAIRRQVGDLRGEGNVLRNLGSIAYYMSNYTQAQDYFRQALLIKQKVGDREGTAMALNGLGATLASLGDSTQAQSCYQQALAISREIGDREGEGMVLNSLGTDLAQQGSYAEAKTYYEQSLYLRQETGSRWGEGLSLCGLGWLSHYQGDDQTCYEYSQQALHIAQDIGESHNLADAWTVQGHALAGLGQLAEASDAYHQALALRRELGQFNLTTEPLAGQASLSLTQKDLPQALSLVEKILNYLETNTLDGTTEPLRVYLTCYRILQANEDSRAPAILTQACDFLQERAARIPDEETRRTFLENVAAHREILELFAKKV